VNVVAMEVLDNLPHDRVERADTASPWQETWVTKSSSGRWAHELRPLEDPTLDECLSTFDWVSEDKEVAGAPYMRLLYPPSPWQTAALVGASPSEGDRSCQI
jgi:Putative S-adenosyl-L-methionine-dependent methyltransferase